MQQSPTTQSQVRNPYRVMVVDDSAIIRGFLSRYLADDAFIDVVTTANNGVMALRALDNYDIEAIVLDIEMPEMDGMTALPKLLEKKPDVQIVMASTLTRKNAEISMRALQLGAVDYVPKPETARSVNASIDFRQELVEKVKAWAARARKKRNQDLPSQGDAPAAPTAGTGRLSAGFVTAARPAVRPAPTFVRPGREAPAVAAKEEPAILPDAAGAKVTLRAGSMRRPKILAIGSSTGGPQALMKFFAQFTKAPEVPVLITQHMPANFTAILAKHLGQSTGWPSNEGQDGEAVKPGHIYVAPGGRHMEVTEGEGAVRIRLTDDPPENFCRPAVDPMFRSLARVYGDTVLAVVLTGMGHDGMKGTRELTRAGGTVMAQDEATSVVWGMPGAVATAGLCTEILPLQDLGVRTAKRLQGVA